MLEVNDILDLSRELLLALRVFMSVSLFMMRHISLGFTLTLMLSPGLTFCFYDTS